MHGQVSQTVLSLWCSYCFLFYDTQLIFNTHAMMMMMMMMMMMVMVMVMMMRMMVVMMMIDG